MEPIVLPKSSNLLKLPEQLYGTIKRVGILNKEPILYGDVNLLKLNDLYYINGAKLIYRYVKSSIEDDSMTYYFDTIKSTATDSLSIPEDERGHIRNTGYLFNEIIYSGDPNLVENGSLFYHDTLPYISIISNVEGVINLSTKVIIDGDPETIVTEYRVGPPHNYSKDYLTFEALEDGTFTLSVPSSINSTYMTSISYSTDDGETWSTTQIDATAQTITTPTINAGDRVLWKGIGNAIGMVVSGTYYYCKFTSTGEFVVNGNIMSLLYGENFFNQYTMPSGTTYNFYGLFRNNNKLLSAKNLILPATTLAGYCYSSMFDNCTSLTTAPTLPATTLADNCYVKMFYDCTSLTQAPELPATTLALGCYYDMFQGCTSLTTAPELPATQLADSCYYDMFFGCKSLTTAPELPATTLASDCYSSMFNGCTSLTTAPVLPATTLANYCYDSMFYGCSNLNYIKAMFTTTPSSTYTYTWVYGVAATGTFVKNNEATWDVTGTSGIPSGWTVETADS